MAEGPTAFRAREAEDLLPTLKQLQNRHPDATMKWFERGQLWDSPEAARVGPRRQDSRPANRFGERHGPRRRFDRKGAPEERRGPGQRHETRSKRSDWRGSR